MLECIVTKFGGSSLANDEQFRKVRSIDNIIQEYAPAMRTESQREAYRTALQLMGDACGFGDSAERSPC